MKMERRRGSRQMNNRNRPGSNSTHNFKPAQVLGGSSGLSPGARLEEEEAGKEQLAAGSELRWLSSDLAWGVLAP